MREEEIDTLLSKNDEDRLNGIVREDDEERAVWQWDKTVAFDVDMLKFFMENMIYSVQISPMNTIVYIPIGSRI